jgi:hypothetical protein
MTVKTQAEAGTGADPIGVTTIVLRYCTLLLPCFARTNSGLVHVVGYTGQGTARQTTRDWGCISQSTLALTAWTGVWAAKRLGPQWPNGWSRCSSPEGVDAQTRRVTA